MMKLLDIFVSAVGLSPCGSSTVHIYAKQQYREQHSNTENTVRNTQNDKNTTYSIYTW
jgi:uncharacterized protein YceK